MAAHAYGRALTRSGAHSSSSGAPPRAHPPQAMVFTDQIFLGHLGTEEMAAAALGNMVGAAVGSLGPAGHPQMECRLICVCHCP